MEIGRSSPPHPRNPLGPHKRHSNSLKKKVTFEKWPSVPKNSEMERYSDTFKPFHIPEGDPQVFSIFGEKYISVLRPPTADNVTLSILDHHRDH